MNYLRWILAGPFFVLGGWIILNHWRLVVLFVAVRWLGGRQRTWESFVPLAGPLFVFLGCLLAPVFQLVRYSWIALIIDPATCTLIAGLPLLWRERTISGRRKKP